LGKTSPFDSEPRREPVRVAFLSAFLPFHVGQETVRGASEPSCGGSQLRRYLRNAPSLVDATLQSMRGLPSDRASEEVHSCGTPADFRSDLAVAVVPTQFWVDGLW